MTTAKQSTRNRRPWRTAAGIALLATFLVLSLTAFGTSGVAGQDEGSDPPQDTVIVDSDGDGLTDVEEEGLGTNPGISDTDTDGIGDGAEVDLGTNPLDDDHDDDGVVDGVDDDPFNAPEIEQPAPAPPEDEEDEESFDTLSRQGGDEKDAALDVPGDPSAGGVQPDFYAGNPDCADLGLLYGGKVDNGVGGTTLYGTYSGDGYFLDWSATVPMDAVIVKGGPNANVYSYNEATADSALHAPINNGEPYELSHVEFCWDADALRVTKDGAGSFTRTYTWTINKAVDGADSADLFMGESATFNYDVTVDQSFLDSNFAITGNISVYNPNPVAVNLSSVTDTLSLSGTATVAGGATSVQPGQTVSFTYSAGATSAAAQSNTAAVAASGVTADGVNFNVSGQGQANILFPANPTTTVGYPTINVDDTLVGDIGSANGDFTFEYSNEVTCGEVEGQYTGTGNPIPNTATIVETEQDDSEEVTVNCYEKPTVSKTAEGDFTRTYDWEIDKSVVDENGEPIENPSADLFVGETADFDYEIDVTQTETDSAFVISGTITITNPNDVPIDIAVTDKLKYLGTVVLEDCPTTVAANDEVVCGYSFATIAQVNDTNTATVDATVASLSTTVEDSEDVVWNDPTIVGSETNTLVDVLGELDEEVSESDTFEYTNTYDCADVEFEGGVGSKTIPNTATLTVTNQSDEESVEINCYELAVSKTADASFTRTYDWEVEKTKDFALLDPEPTSLTLSIGQTQVVTYSVVYSEESTDSDHVVSGTITITNPAPMDAEVEVTDVLDNKNAGVVDCHEATIVPANDEIICDYTADDDGTATENTATVTLGDFEFTDDAAVDYDDATIEEIDECIDVEDTFDGSNVVGTVCLDDLDDDLSIEFEYEQTLQYLECGDDVVENTASFMASADENNTDQSDSDTVTFDVSVPCGGCTLTPGYWKTHSLVGPAPYDDAWLEIGASGADTLFFATGKTYYNVLWTPPTTGNANYILAHAYIAAELNALNEATVPASVQTALDAAETYFNTLNSTNKSLDVAPRGAARATLINLASTLDTYNNGLTAGGPVHCTQ